MYSDRWLQACVMAARLDFLQCSFNVNVCAWGLMCAQWKKAIMCMFFVVLGKSVMVSACRPAELWWSTPGTAV